MTRTTSRIYPHRVDRQSAALACPGRIGASGKLIGERFCESDNIGKSQSYGRAEMTKRASTKAPEKARPVKHISYVSVSAKKADGNRRPAGSPRLTLGFAELKQAWADFRTRFVAS